MRSILSLAGLAFALGSLPACSETPPPAAPVVPLAPTAPPVVTATPVAPVDLTPVPEPADLVLMARWKTLRATVSSLVTCTGMPATFAETSLRRLVDRALLEVFRNESEADRQQMAELVNVDGSLDVVSSLEPGRSGKPRLLTAFSVGLSSLERAKQVLLRREEPVELTPGQWQVGGLPEGGLTCVVGAAAGAAPARLICGLHPKDVTTLGPYLARNLPLTEPSTHQVHAEARWSTLEARYGAELRQGLSLLPTLARAHTVGEERFDHALSEAVVALANEGTALVADLDGASLDLDIDADTCLTARMALQFRGKSSWLARAIEENGERSSAPPALFWHMPMDSDAAFWSRTPEVSRDRGILRSLGDLAEGLLAQQQIGNEADRRSLSGLMTLPFGSDTHVVMASGQGPDRSPGPLGTLGWTLLGFDEGPEALTKLLKEVVAVYGRKRLLDPLRKALGTDANLLPMLRLIAPPKGLGKGTLDLEMAFVLPGNKQQQVVVHGLVMPDGKNTWLAVGGDRDELATRLQGVKTGAPEASTLAARLGLEGMRAGKATSQGFVTLGMFTRGLDGMFQIPQVLSKVPNGLPNKGETPMLLTAQVTGAGPRSELKLHVPKGTLEDLRSLLMTSSQASPAQP